MNILGIDTSTAATAVCVMRSDGESFETSPKPGARPAHAAELMPAVREALDAAGLAFGKLDAIGVGVGPGGFTGLRIGISTARALGAATGKPLRPVSSLQALAANIEADHRLALIDAKRGELFALQQPGGEELVAAPEEVAAKSLPGSLAAGDGAIRFRDVLEAAGVRVAPLGSGAHTIRGLSICRLAIDAPATALQAVLPRYLREPDAKPQTR